MKIFTRALLVFLYFCMAFFIKPNEAYAINNALANIQYQSIISKSKSEIVAVNKTKEYYIVSQNRNKTQISNSSNKNQGFGTAFDKNTSSKNIIQYSTFGKNINCHSRISHNTSLNLKNAIYTRAP